MNMKTLAVLVLMGLSLSAFADHCADLQAHNATTMPAGGQELADWTARKSALTQACNEQNQSTTDAERRAREGENSISLNSLPASAGSTTSQRCNAVIEMYNATAALPTATAAQKTKSADVKHCENLKKLSGGQLAEVNPRENTVKSMDGAVTCRMVASYTVDFESCEKAVAHYNFVVNAEVAMDLQQKIRTDLKNKSIQEEASRKAAAGDYQTGALDAGIDSHKHMKQMNTEKMAAYSMAVAALVRAYMIIPGEKYALQRCAAGGNAADAQDSAKICPDTIKNNKGAVLANQDAKAGIGLAIAKFTAKGVAAGIAMGQNRNAAAKIEEAKKNFEEPTEDMLMERCVFNPTDPACAKPGNRVSGQSFSGGEFGLGDAGGNNAFDMNPEGENLVEVGAETNLDGEGVSSINSPFAEEAKNASKILDPAAAAQMQASGGAAGGGGGGSGGGGGGGASLGSDLAGADKDGDKEAQIKTNKVSGVYGASGGGGFKGIGKGKDDANPFASLFDAKSNGGIEEDRSIASGDIDGAASGLFQKISKRYGQIQADKRIETKNLE